MDREYIIAKVEAQIRADGLDPEHLTLDQAWGYFCFNPDWDSREGHAGRAEPSPADIRKDVP